MIQRPQTRKVFLWRHGATRLEGRLGTQQLDCRNSVSARLETAPVGPRDCLEADVGGR